MTKEQDAEDFATLLDQFEQQQARSSGGDTPKVGDRVEGTLVSIGSEVAFVDLGVKAEGVVDVGELRNEDGELVFAAGDTVEALVTAIDPDSGSLVLRVRPGRGEALRSELEQAYRHKMPVEGLVKAINKGGVEVEVAGIRGFCPISQLERRYVEDAGEYVGRRLSFRVTRYEEGGRGRGPNLVLSRRVLLDEEAKAQAAETRAKLDVGSVVRGTVTSLASYGAFVDLGGLEGLLHVSEIGHSRLAHPSDVLSVGQEIEVQVLKIEAGTDAKGRERISLSARALEADPWHDAAARFAHGTVAQGRVVRLESYGAFVELAAGVEGMVHVSELGSERRVNHARELLQVGETVQVKVLNLDPERRRIALSVAAVRAQDEDREYEDYQRQSSGSSSGFGSLGDFFKSSEKKK